MRLSSSKLRNSARLITAADHLSKGTLTICSDLATEAGAKERIRTSLGKSLGRWSSAAKRFPHRSCGAVPFCIRLDLRRNPGENRPFPVSSLARNRNSVCWRPERESDAAGIGQPCSGVLRRAPGWFSKRLFPLHPHAKEPDLPRGGLSCRGGVSAFPAARCEAGNGSKHRTGADAFVKDAIEWAHTR